MFNTKTFCYNRSRSMSLIRNPISSAAVIKGMLKLSFSRMCRNSSSLRRIWGTEELRFNRMWQRVIMAITRSTKVAPEGTRRAWPMKALVLDAGGLTLLVSDQIQRSSTTGPRPFDFPQAVNSCTAIRCQQQSRCLMVNPSQCTS